MQHTNKTEEKRLTLQGYSVVLVPSQEDSYFERSAMSCPRGLGGDRVLVKSLSDSLLKHFLRQKVCVEVQFSAPNIFLKKDLSMCRPSHTPLPP